MSEAKIKVGDIVSFSWTPERRVVTEVSGGAFTSIPLTADHCQDCGRLIQVGDWAWCKGNQEDHVDPTYSFQWGKGGPFTPRS